MPSPQLKKPKAVFFDWDGTLVDSYGFLNDAHGDVLAALGFAPFRDGEYKEYFGMPREVLYPKIYGDKCDEAKALFEKYVFANADKIKSMNGSTQLLETLSDMDIVTGVVSNKKADYIVKEAQHMGWESFFRVIIGAGQAAQDKPSPAPLHYALARCGLDYAPSDIWFVGDTGADLACAREFGCVSIFVEGHKDSDVLIAEYKPDLIVADCAQMRKILVAL